MNINEMSFCAGRIRGQSVCASHIIRAAGGIIDRERESLCLDAFSFFFYHDCIIYLGNGGLMGVTTG